MHKSRRPIIILVAALLVASCAVTAPPVSVAPTAKDPRYPNCVRPSDVTLNDLDISTATTEIGSVKVGAITYKSTPKLATVVSSASDKSLVVVYLMCLATESGEVSNNDQGRLAYLREYLSFLQSDPTAAEQLKWQEMKQTQKSPSH